MNAQPGTKRCAGGAALLLLAALALAAPARAVQVGIATGIPGTVGDTLDVAVSTSDLTGQEVYSYEMDLTYNANGLTLIDVIESGSLTASWGDAAFSTGPGSATVAAAGGTALGGAGDLTYLRFVLGPSYGTYAVLFADFRFNEGAPEDTTTNGSVSISQPPSILVSPNSGEILVGNQLAFSSTGTPPFTWGVTDPAVASVDTAGVLTGIAPGVTRVFVEDAAAVTDTTNGEILVRAMSLSAPVGITAPPGGTFTMPIDVSDLTGLDVHAFEFEMSFTASQLEVTGADFTGTLGSAWAAPTVLTEPGHVRVVAAGTTALTGAGTLVSLECAVPSNATSSTGLSLSNGLFDERFVPIHVAGSFVVDLPPAIFINPNTATVLAGDTQAFSLTGSVTPPVTWGTTDPGVGTIDATGLFTGVGGGECLVFAEDAGGARDTSGVVSVCDLQILVPNQSVELLAPETPIAVDVDRDVSGLEIYGYEFTLAFNAARIHAIAATDSGAISAGWGPPVVNLYADSVRIAHAGGTPLAGSGTLVHVYFAPDSLAVDGQTSPVTFASLTLNEGTPVACTQNGTLTVEDTGTGVAEGFAGGLALAPGRPNPFTSRTVIQYSIRPGFTGAADLRIIDAAGRVVRRFDLAGAGAGPHAVRWDGRDDDGAQVASGVYWVRLASGDRIVTRKVTRVR